MVGFRRNVTDATYLERVYEARGLGRLVEPDPRVRGQRLHPWTRCAVRPDGCAVRLSWVRDITQGLHSVDVVYARDAVGIGLRLGTRPGMSDVAGLLTLNVVVEHTVVPLREPLGERRIVMLREPGDPSRTGRLS